MRAALQKAYYLGRRLYRLRENGDENTSHWYSVLAWHRLDDKKAASLIKRYLWQRKHLDTPQGNAYKIDAHEDNLQGSEPSPNPETP